MITPYKRAATAQTMTGQPILLNRFEAYLTSLDIRARIDRAQQAKICYRMRLAAMVASDKRKGKVWEH